MSSLGEVLRFVDEFVDRAGLDERVGLRLTLAVEELFTNLVRHNRGGGDQIEVHLNREGDQIQLGLVDVDVEPFDPTTVAAVPVSLGIHERRPGGLGVHLVRSLFDSLDYQYDEERRRMRILVTTTVGR
jgi:serine/threonine-protein kinase RsbW